MQLTERRTRRAAAANVEGNCQLLVLGAGMAADALLGRLGHYGFQGSITLVGDETVAGYNRVLLPHYVGGSVETSDLLSTARTHQANLKIDRRLGIRAESLDISARCVQLSDGGRVRYENIVLSLGSQALAPAGIKLPHPRVTALRNWRDADHLIALADEGSAILVVGGGLLGLEVADALLARQCDVTLLQRSHRLLSRQVDERAATLVHASLRNKGMDIVLQEEVTALESHGDGVTVAFNSHRAPRHFAGVVLATGCLPRTELARNAGVPTRRGIVVDLGMASPAPNVFAIGECAETSGVNYQLVEPMHQQADVLARNLCGASAVLTDVVESSHLKVEGVPLFFAGSVPSSVGGDDTVVDDSEGGVYRRLCFDGDVLRGAVLFGDTLGARDIQEFIGSAVSPAKAQQLAFALKAA